MSPLDVGREPVTMAEIDEARGLADVFIGFRRTCPFDPCPACAERVKNAELAVLALLTRWWEQGCKEVLEGR